MKAGVTMRNKIIEAIDKEKIIVIVRGIKKELLLPLAQAMYDGGIRLLEVTYDASCKETNLETADKIRVLQEHFDGKMFIGAGTVLTKEQVDLTYKANGTFIISPNTDAEVIKATRNYNMVSLPGALTPSEIYEAHKAGADYVKLFPITSMGPEYVKAVTAPLSNVKLLAVGGIDENNMDDYLKAGISGFGVGSNIIDKKCLANGDFAGITALAKKYTERLTK